MNDVERQSLVKDFRLSALCKNDIMFLLDTGGFGREAHFPDKIVASFLNMELKEIFYEVLKAYTRMEYGNMQVKSHHDYNGLMKRVDYTM